MISSLSPTLHNPAANTGTAGHSPLLLLALATALAPLVAAAGAANQQLPDSAVQTFGTNFVGWSTNAPAVYTLVRARNPRAPLHPPTPRRPPPGLIERLRDSAGGFGQPGKRNFQLVEQFGLGIQMLAPEIDRLLFVRHSAFVLTQLIQDHGNSSVC